MSLEAVREEFGAKRVTKALREKAEDILRAEIVSYDAYLDGRVYGYVIEQGGEEIDVATDQAPLTFICGRGEVIPGLERELERFFIGGFAVPMWGLLHWLASANVAWLAVATCMAYYLNYEWLHFAYHCPDDSAIARLPGVRTLRRGHRRHHARGCMARCNFNITYPVGDWLFGTRCRD